MEGKIIPKIISIFWDTIVLIQSRDANAATKRKIFEKSFELWLGANPKDAATIKTTIEILKQTKKDTNDTADKKSDSIDDQIKQLKKDWDLYNSIH